ncbi:MULTISPECIES: hypothetical protein [unclassified Kitasatospora]|uniref:hypothetical protein n=1 Tax=unclassified Kitasatospora TaxID=2633591 RepID=UPI0024768297|nr:hypothetical protein [Kitasatospora sp. MAP12-44]
MVKPLMEGIYADTKGDDRETVARFSREYTKALEAGEAWAFEAAILGAKRESKKIFDHLKAVWSREAPEVTTGSGGTAPGGNHGTNAVDATADTAPTSTSVATIEDAPVGGIPPQGDGAHDHDTAGTSDNLPTTGNDSVSTGPEQLPLFVVERLSTFWRMVENDLQRAKAEDTRIGRSQQKDRLAKKANGHRWDVYKEVAKAKKEIERRWLLVPAAGGDFDRMLELTGTTTQELGLSEESADYVRRGMRG